MRPEKAMGAAVITVIPSYYKYLKKFWAQVHENCMKSARNEIYIKTHIFVVVLVTYPRKIKYNAFLGLRTCLRAAHGPRVWGAWSKLSSSHFFLCYL